MNPRHVEWAKRFHKIVEKRSRTFVSYKVYIWANSFKTILKKVKGDEKRIDTLLDILEQHHNDSDWKLPKIDNPKHITTSTFEWVEDQIAKHKNGHARNGFHANGKAEKVPPSAEAKEILSRIKTNHWPNGTGGELPSAVQQSLDNYSTFLQSLKAFRSSDQLLNAFAKELRRRFTSPIPFVEQWFQNMNEWMQSKEWKGGLQGISFRVDSVMFTRQGREYASDYCGRADVWDSLMEVL